MSDAHAVAVRDGRDELLKDRRRVGLGELPAGGETGVEVGRVAEVGDDVEVVLVLVHLVDLEDVGVAAEEGEDLGLLVEAVAVGGVVGEEALVDGLAGEGGARGGGEAAVDDAESPAAEFFAELVVAI